MNIHKHARSCPASRELLVKRVSARECSVHEASEAAGISERRGREWIRRARASEPFTDRSSRPHTTHVAVDDFTRFSYVDILADERSESSSTFLENAVEWFARQKVIIERVMTDKRAGCASMRIKHKRIRPYTPKTNGKAERFIQTLLREWAYRFSYETSDERRRWLTPYLHFYNYHRAHSAVAYNPPISCLDRNNVLTRNS